MRKSRGKQERGAKEEILERRCNVFALRAQGMSYRGIAEKLDISANSVFNDVQWCADNWGQIPENSKDALRGQLVGELATSQSEQMNRQAQRPAGPHQ